MQVTRREQIRRLRQVAMAALPRYGIEPASISLLQHQYNTTFLVTTPDRDRHVLHILRPTVDELSESRRRTRVESELWWQDRVRADLDLSVPKAVRTPSGDGAVCVDVAGAAPLLCTLLHWVDGRRLHLRLAPVHLEAVGRLTARLHDHSARLRVPGWFDRPRVDKVDAETEGDVVPLFAQHVSVEAAEVVKEVLDRVRAVQRELGAGPETFGVIHADVHQKNYLFRGRDVRLIDFGDCGWGHYLYDLAVTVSELRALPRRAELRAGLLGGYRRLRDLPPAHEALIDTFVMLREVQNLTWFVKARDDPSYAGRSEQIADGVTGLKASLRAGA